jgi:hypothetical protein
MITCILLNQTHGRQVRPMIDEVWRILPHPARVMALSPADGDRLKALLRPLGFVNKRVHAIYRNTADYIEGKPLHDCYCMGKYGRDAIDIFVHGKTDIEPSDKWLKPYIEWRRAGGEPVKWGESQ